jgi:hypothetical protein
MFWAPRSFGTTCWPYGLKVLDRVTNVPVALVSIVQDFAICWRHAGRRVVLSSHVELIFQQL